MKFAKSRNSFANPILSNMPLTHYASNPSSWCLARISIPLSLWTDAKRTFTTPVNNLHQYRKIGHGEQSDRQPTEWDAHSADELSLHPTRHCVALCSNEIPSGTLKHTHEKRTTPEMHSARLWCTNCVIDLCTRLDSTLYRVEAINSQYIHWQKTTEFGRSVACSSNFRLRRTINHPDFNTQSSADCVRSPFSPPPSSTYSSVRFRCMQSVRHPKSWPSIPLSNRTTANRTETDERTDEMDVRTSFCISFRHVAESMHTSMMNRSILIDCVVVLQSWFFFRFNEISPHTRMLTYSKWMCRKHTKCNPD